MAEMAGGQIEEVTCREFVELVTNYWEGTLPEDRLELFEEHIVMCDWCKSYLDQMDSTVRALGGAGGPEEERAAGPDESLLAAFREWSGRA
jgi:predicted anti-sigma-YlaC factor YlaD